MASRTYLIGLYNVLKVAHRYATRYQAQIQQVATPAQYACLVDTIQALASCLGMFIPEPPPH